MKRLKSFLLLLLLLFGIVGCIPKTNVVKLRFDNALQDLTDLSYWDTPEFLTDPLDYNDVVEIALTNNLDVYAQEYERESQARISNSEHLKMLPPLTIEGFWGFRNRSTAAFQDSVIPKELEPPTPTGPQFPVVSSLKTTVQANARLTIKNLDMALAYFRAKQEKKKTLILQQQHIRARQKLIMDIAEAYWQAVSAKASLEEVEQLSGKAEEFQTRLKQNVARRTLSALEGLDLESRIVDNQIQIEAIRYQYESSKAKLAGLMGLIPGTEFELKDIDLIDTEIVIEDLRCVEKKALFMRPELAVKDLEEKIAMDKIREAVVPMFPDASAYGDTDYDGNPFLVFNYWNSVGSRAIWNLFLLAQQWQLKRSGEQQVELAHVSRLALTVAVMTQVHVAYLNYRDAVHQYKLALRSYEVRSQLADVAERVRLAGQFKGIDVVTFTTNALIAKINAWKAYSGVQIAKEQLNFAIGIPLHGTDE